jgi:SAM-dependent methyltransferase
MGYEISAHLYDLFDRKENLDFFLHFESRAGSVLDIGAGTGRIAIHLAERGVEITCVEPSPAMKHELSKKLSRRPDVVEKIQAIPNDASSFKAGRAFPTANLSGTFDHFLNDEEHHSALANIGRHLLPGGLLVFDVFLGLMEDEPLSQAGTVKMDSMECRRFVSRKLLPDNQMEVLLVFELDQSGMLVERIEERSRVGVIDRPGVQRILHKVGFEVVQEFCDYEFIPFRMEMTC